MTRRTVPVYVRRRGSAICLASALPSASAEAGAEAWTGPLPGSLAVVDEEHGLTSLLLDAAARRVWESTGRVGPLLALPPHEVEAAVLRVSPAFELEPLRAAQNLGSGLYLRETLALRPRGPLSNRHGNVPSVPGEQVLPRVP